MSMSRLILKRAVVSALGAAAFGSASAQGFTATINDSGYYVESIFNDGCSGCPSFVRYWVNPHDPTEDVSIDCSWTRSATSANLVHMDHTIVSYLQYVRTQTWANYEHVLRADSGHISGTLWLRVTGLPSGWAGYSIDFLGDGSIDVGPFSAGDRSMPVIFGSHGLVNNLEFYYDEVAWSYNTIDFDPAPSGALVSEGAECGSSLSAIIDDGYHSVHVEASGVPSGAIGAMVVGLSALSLPIPMSACSLGTDIVAVVPTIPVASRGSAVFSVQLPPYPVAFRLQHLHCDPSSPGSSGALLASNTLRVLRP